MTPSCGCIFLQGHFEICNFHLEMRKISAGEEVLYYISLDVSVSGAECRLTPSDFPDRRRHTVDNVKTSGAAAVRVCFSSLLLL